MFYNSLCFINVGFDHNSEQIGEGRFDCCLRRTQGNLLHLLRFKCKIVLGICPSSWLKVIELLTGENHNFSCWQQEELVRNYCHHSKVTDFL